MGSVMQPVVMGAGGSGAATVAGTATSAFAYGTDTEFSMTVDNGTDIGYLFSFWSRLKTVTIGAGVTAIGANCFEGCTGLTSATIPEGVTAIRSAVFKGCTSLTSVTIPSTTTGPIGAEAFRDCSALTALTVPEGVTSLGASSLYSCQALASLTLPSTLTVISDYALANTYSLTSVTLPASLASIGQYAFYGSGLTSLLIPEGISTFGAGTFRDTNLASLDLPSTVTDLSASYLLRDSGYLMELTVRATTPPIAPNLQWTPATCAIRVPAASVAAYQAAAGWSARAAYISAI